MRSSSIAGLLNEHDYQLQAEELKIWIDNLLTSKLKSNLRGCFSLKPQYCQTSPYIMILGVLLTEFEMYNYRFTSWCSLPTAQQLWLTASFISSVLKRFSSFLLSPVPSTRWKKISSRRVKSKGKSTQRLQKVMAGWEISGQAGFLTSFTHILPRSISVNQFLGIPLPHSPCSERRDPTQPSLGQPSRSQQDLSDPGSLLPCSPPRPSFQLITHWTWINRHLEPWQSLSLLTGEASVHCAPLHPWLPWMFFR